MSLRKHIRNNPYVKVLTENEVPTDNSTVVNGLLISKTSRDEFLIYNKYNSREVNEKDLALRLKFLESKPLSMDFHAHVGRLTVKRGNSDKIEFYLQLISDCMFNISEERYIKSPYLYLSHICYVTRRGINQRKIPSIYSQFSSALDYIDIYFENPKRFQDEIVEEVLNITSGVDNYEGDVNSEVNNSKSLFSHLVRAEYQGNHNEVKKIIMTSIPHTIVMINHVDGGKETDAFLSNISDITKRYARYGFNSKSLISEIK